MRITFKTGTESRGAMKKLLLFGTILCVAGTAFAFGGIFKGGSSGSKSTLYKGGLDVIGVHFGGKEVPCPANSEKIDGLC